jgi:hypothetical protein
VFGREGQPQDVVQKAEQTEFPGFEKPAEKPKEKPKAKPKMEIRGTRRVMGDWQAIPGGKHGGQRRKRGNRYEYRYPAKGGGWSAKPQKTEPKPVIPKKKEPSAEKKVPPVDSSLWRTGPAFGSAGGPIKHSLTEAGRSLAAKVATGLPVKAVNALEALAALGAGSSPVAIEQAVGSKHRLTPFGKEHGSPEALGVLTHRGFAELAIVGGQDRHYRLTGKGKQSMQQIALERDLLLGRVQSAHPIDQDEIPITSRGKPGPPGEKIPPRPVEAGQSVAAEVIEHKPKKAKRGVRGSRGQVFADLGTKPEEWGPTEIAGFQETEVKGRGGQKETKAMPLFNFPKGYKKPETMFADPGGGETAPCQICGTGIKNVYWIQHDKKKLILAVGSECVGKYFEAHMPEAATAIKKIIRAKVKVEEVDAINALIAKGHDMDTAVGRVRARTNAAKVWDKKYPKPTAEQSEEWERKRHRIAAAREKKFNREWLPPDEFALLREDQGDWGRLNVGASLVQNWEDAKANHLQAKEIAQAVKMDPQVTEWTKILAQHKANQREWNLPEDQRKNLPIAEETRQHVVSSRTEILGRPPHGVARSQSWVSDLDDLIRYSKEHATYRVQDELGLPRTGYRADHARRNLQAMMGRGLWEEEIPEWKARSAKESLAELGPNEQKEWIEKYPELKLEKSWDAQLERLRPRLVLRPTSHPMELVWMAEELPDNLHETFQRTPPGWPAEDGMEKAVGHRYVKRVPTGKPKPKYRYWYRIPGKGLTSSKDIQQGSKFKVEHQGALGHFEVVHHDEHNNVVSVKHDESGRVAHIRERDLHRMITSHHEKQTKKVTKPKEEPKPEEMKLRREEQQPELPGTGKAEKPKAEKPKAPPKKLPRASMEDLGKGGFDNIEGFSKDAKELELQASQMKTDREFAVIPQPGGFVLASRKRAPGKVKESPGDKAEFLMRDTKGSGITKDSAEYVMMEAADVIASHDSQSFDQRKDYPEGVQERRYHDVPEEQNKIDRIARSIEPSLVVNTNPDAINGTPIVTEDGVVLGGNGRTMGMQRAYKLYPESGKKLKEYLIRHARAFGVPSAEVEGMKQPILVRRMKAGKDTDKLRGLGRRMNEALTQGMDPRTMEVALGQNYVTPELLDSLSHNMGDETLSKFLGGARSRPFISSLERAGIIDQFNRAEFVDKKTGLLNEDGRLRVERVLTARMLPNASVLSRMGSRLRGTIAKSVPSFIQMEKGGWDVRKALDLAVRADNDMRLKGFSGGTRPSKEAGKKIKIPMSEHRANYSKQSGLFGEAAGEEDLPAQLQKDKTAQAMLAALQDKADKNMPSKWRGIALEADRQKHGAGGFAAFAPEKKSLEDSIREVFELEVPKAEPKQAGLALSMPQPDLLKAEDGKALTRYLMHAVVWEANNLIRQAVAANAKLEGARLLERLRRFVLDQAKSDKRFAQALGAHPLNESDLKALLKASAMAHTAELAKSLAASSLWNDWSQAYAG